MNNENKISVIIRRTANKVFHGGRARTSASSIEPFADLNLGDLCVLLCGSLFPPVVGDLAQKIPKIAEWPSRNEKILGNHARLPLTSGLPHPLQVRTRTKPAPTSTIIFSKFLLSD
jgi:hypothetical protein